MTGIRAFFTCSGVTAAGVPAYTGALTARRVSACTPVTAASNDIPGARRPIRSSQLAPRSASQLRPTMICACIEMGIQMSVAVPTITPRKPGGVMPMIVYGAPLIVMVRLSARGSAANRVVQ